MNDDFDRRDWVDDLNAGIRNRDTWFRGIKIVILFLFLIAVRVVLALITLFQFCHCLVRNRPSGYIMPAGSWLAHYVEDVILFVTWNSDRAPFPFSPLSKVNDEEPPVTDEKPAAGPDAWEADQEENRFEAGSDGEYDDPDEFDESPAEKSENDSGTKPDGDDYRSAAPPRPDA